MARNDRFTNKVVSITGAASGIGRAAALAFAAEGARVAILDRSADALRPSTRPLRRRAARCRPSPVTCPRPIRSKARSSKSLTASVQ